MDAEPPSSTLALIAFVLLLAVNAWLVAAEYSLLTVRRTRIEQAARLGGGAGPKRVLRALDQLEELAFAAQIVRSAISFALALLAIYVSDAWARAAAGPWDRWWVLGVSLRVTDVAAAVALLLAVLLHATIGQQLPKLLALHRAEWIATRLAARPLTALAWLLWPLVRGLGALARALMRLFGVAPGGFHPLTQTPDEIRQMVREGGASAATDLEADEREMLRGVFDFRETVAREVMTPRTDLIAVAVDVSLDELIRVVSEEAHSRLPVYEGTVDNVVGVFLTKDLIPLLHRQGDTAPFDIRSCMREPYFVPDTKPVHDVLTEFRQYKVHLAVVLDEFGGTYGVVTMEDLLEEIVGEIEDEHDEATPDFAPTPEGDVLIEGGAAIDEVNERFGLALPEEDFDTVGGYVFGALGRVPEAGESVAVAGPEGEMLYLRVEEVEERRVTTVRLTRTAPSAPSGAPVEPLVPALGAVAGQR